MAGITSTGSKRPDALFGAGYDGSPRYLTSSAGARVRDETGREYLDLVMALGAVALGYRHPEVDRAVKDAIDRGTVGSLPPEEEEALAAELAAVMPHLERLRFFKTGAEAVAAAIRLARVHTGRELVLGCGYHGWLDWCSRGEGIPGAVAGLYAELRFNDPEHAATAIRAAGDQLACVVVEPVVETAPLPDWLDTLRDETRRVGAVLVFDEIKTALRVAMGGAVARWGGDPDLVVLGKAIANGYPLAAVGGSTAVMRGVSKTWISSTLATEMPSFAAARATVRVARADSLPDRLAAAGRPLLAGFERLAAAFPRQVTRARGLPQMCHLEFGNDAESARVARGCARHGLLFKRTAYNFVSLAHTEQDIAAALDILERVLGENPGSDHAD